MTGNRDDDPMSVLSGMMQGWLGGDAGEDMMRSFSEVNKRGLEAAGQLVARMTDLVDGATGSAAKHWAPTDGTRPVDSTSSSAIRSEVLQAIDMWADLMVSLVDKSLEMLPSDEASGGSPKAVVIGPMTPGDRASQPLYAHSILGQGLVRCRVGRFESASGESLEPGCVTVEPEVMMEGNAERTAIHVALPVSTAPDRYHGFVFADGVSSAAIAVEILVVMS
jgi:hypothetical protein